VPFNKLWDAILDGNFEGLSISESAFLYKQRLRFRVFRGLQLNLVGPQLQNQGEKGKSSVVVLILETATFQGIAGIGSLAPRQGIIDPFSFWR